MQSLEVELFFQDGQIVIWLVFVWQYDFVVLLVEMIFENLYGEIDWGVLEGCEEW